MASSDDAPRDDRDTVRDAATSLADLSHRPVEQWSSDDFEQVQTHLDTLMEAGYLSGDEDESADLREPFVLWDHGGLSEGEQAEAVHYLRNEVLPTLPEPVVAEIVGRPPSERDLSGGDPESAWRMVAPRMPADRWDAADREDASYYLSVLADADVYPDHATGLIERLAAWNEDDREDLLDALREYATEARECVHARSDEQAGGWRAEYETTTHRGPDRYPVPEDWTLGIVEGDGIMWKRPECPDDAREWSPEDRAGTLNDCDFDADEQTVKFDVNSDPVFTVTEPDRDDLMRAIAEVLARVARGEEFHDVAPPEDYGASEGDDERAEQGDEQTATLGDFGG